MSNPIEIDHYEPFLREIKGPPGYIEQTIFQGWSRNVLSPDALRTALDEGRRAFLQANG